MGALAVAMATLPDPGLAQGGEESELGWSLKSELSAVFTGGNQTSTTFGFGGTLTRRAERSKLEIEAASIFQESGLKTRQAVGTPGSFVLSEETERTTTAESYGVGASYDYDVSERFFVTGGAEWLRNTFAGVDSRYVLIGGAGNLWADREAFRLSTDYALTYTVEDPVVDDPEASDSFLGLRAGYELFRSLTATTDFESELVADWNLDNTGDVKLEWRNATPVSISDRLALKPSLRLLWRNEPALASVPLVDTGGTPTGESVQVPLEKLDTFFTLALVVTL
jgi:putative salt-induced outer membrane protein YdiY